MVKVISSAVGFIPTEELFAINCRITSFPKSDVTIFFRKCPIRQECLKDWIPIWNTTVGSMVYRYTLFLKTLPQKNVFLILFSESCKLQFQHFCRISLLVFRLNIKYKFRKQINKRIYTKNIYILYDEF